MIGRTLKMVYGIMMRGFIFNSRIDQFEEEKCRDFLALASLINLYLINLKLGNSF